MPDWIYSKLTVEGDNAEKILRSLCVEADDPEEPIKFDFNKIIPMPQELNIVCSSVTDKCMRLYAGRYYKDKGGRCNKYVEVYNGYNSDGHLEGCQMYQYEWDAEMKYILESYDEKVAASMGYPYFRTEDAVLDYGKRALDNIIEFGYRDWYDWRRANWGTKWNACDCRLCDNAIYFSTAWCGVGKLIEKLSVQHPHLLFTYEFAHENVGYCVGRRSYKSGCQVAGCTYDDCTKEAYELAFELVGCQANYEFDEELQNYKRIDE